MINKDEFINLYNSGLSYKNIADKLGITVTKSKYMGKKFGIISRKSGAVRIDLTGNRFDELTVLNYDESSQKYICSCSCGNVVSRTSSSLSKPIGVKMCWNCRNIHISKIKWKGFGEIGMDKWNAIISSASARNIQFNLSIEEAWELFLLQKRKCAISDVILNFNHRRAYRSETTASLDRINSAEGYILGNVQWVHKTINCMKSDMSQFDFINLCRAISENNP